MKKTLIMVALTCFMVFATSVFAGEPATLLNAATSTGLGTEYKFDRAYPWHTCMATWGGTAPTNIRFGIHFADESGTYDTTNYDVDVTMTSSPWRFYIALYKGGKYAKGNYISKSGGDGTTSITLKCTGERLWR